MSFAFTAAAKSIAAAERLNEDEALKELLGFKRFPNQSALGEWLRNIGEAEADRGAGDLPMRGRSGAERSRFSEPDKEELEEIALPSNNKRECEQVRRLGGCWNVRRPHP